MIMIFPELSALWNFLEKVYRVFKKSCPIFTDKTQSTTIYVKLDQYHHCSQ